MRPGRHLTTLPRLACWLFGAAWFWVAAPAAAWGDDGHRVVGEIAWHYLSAPARAAVSESLTEPGYETLAEAATWPDRFARRFPEYDPMKPFHYVNVAAATTSYRRERDCPTGCVVTALSQFVALLESQEPPLSVSERRRAIYWIAHFVGDIHQPLHVAHPDGKGGTATVVRFFDEPDKRNAHWIWDIGLIERRPTSAVVATDPSNYRALADELIATLAPGQLLAFQRLTSAQEIANESLALARRHAFLQTTDQVDERYLQQRWPVVARQLQRAGVRLAAILNRALTQPTP